MEFSVCSVILVFLSVFFPDAHLLCLIPAPQVLPSPEFSSSSVLIQTSKIILMRLFLSSSPPWGWHSPCKKPIHSMLFSRVKHSFFFFFTVRFMKTPCGLAAACLSVPLSYSHPYGGCGTRSYVNAPPSHQLAWLITCLGLWSYYFVCPECPPVPVHSCHSRLNCECQSLG